MFQKPFSFEGRIRRTEYGITTIIYAVAYLLIMMLGIDMPLIALLFYIPFVWFMLAQGAKRCHDKGRSGWWQILPFYGLLLIFSDGQPHENEYGADPKGRDELYEEAVTE